MRACVAVLVLALASCAPRVEPRFASWEPLRSDIPRSASRAQAQQRLAESYALWKKWLAARPPSVLDTGRAVEQGPGTNYSYLRAEQQSPEQVTFTLLEVQAERVVLRALLTADPRKLRLHGALHAQRSFHSRWIERGNDVGRHAEGAAVKTVDELYRDCASLLQDEHSSLPRLYFHPDGLLMQCGYPPSECDDCASASIQSVARFSVSAESPKDDAAAWLCETELGPVAPGTLLPLLPDNYACYARYLPPPRPVTPAEQGQAQDICIIDPSACAPPPEALVGAYITQARPAICGGGPERDALPLEVGKSEPRVDWVFPFWRGGGEVECACGTFSRRIRP